MEKWNSLLLIVIERQTVLESIKTPPAQPPNGRIAYLMMPILCQTILVVLRAFRMRKKKSPATYRIASEREYHRERAQVCGVTAQYNYSHCTEAPTGFEPVYGGFANRCLSLLATAPFSEVVEHPIKYNRQNRFFCPKLIQYFSIFQLTILLILKNRENFAIKNCFILILSYIKIQSMCAV